MVTLDRTRLGLRTSLSSVLKRVAAACAERKGRLKVKTSTAPSLKPTIYFLTPDYQVPSGGILVIYRHVDILNKAGINAVVLHQRAGFRCDWFENQTPICYVEDTVVLHGDLLVVSEISVSTIQSLEKGTRYAIFNQNTHLTWRQGEQAARVAYRASSDLAGVLTVSDHNAAMLQYGFPHLDVFHLRLSIDPDIFYPSVAPRPKRICYMPRRSSDDAVQVMSLLKNRDAFQGWEFVPLNGLAHAAIGEELRKSRIFMAFTRQEGFGLPAAEAMACGCYVVGNHGYGGTDFFREDFAAPVASGDILGFSQAVEQAVINDEREPGWCQRQGAEAARYIAATYSPTHESEQVCAIYCELMRGAAAKTADPQPPRSVALGLRLDAGVHGHQG